MKTGQAARWRGALSLGLLLGGLLLGPGGCARGKHAPANPRAGMAVSRDATRLRDYLRLPAHPVAVRWIVRPRGVAGMAPGPTDTTLYAHVRLDADGWRKLAPLATGKAARLSLPAEAAPLRMDPGPATPDPGAELVGDGYDAGKIGTYWYPDGVALRQGDGLWIALGSR
jgi:hypothetical protein